MDVVNALYVAGGALGIAVTLATLAWRGFIGPAIRELVSQGHEPLADKIHELATTIAAIAPATDSTDSSDGLADKIDELSADITAIKKDVRSIQSPQSGIRQSLQAIKTDTETILHG